MSKKHGGLLVDLGNVIIAHWLSNITSNNFEQIDYNSIPEVPGVFEALRKFSIKFSGNVSVVYNATGIATEKIRNWLIFHQFTERTGIELDRVIWSTNGRNKTQYTDQSSQGYMGTTVVVDDRLEVLSHFVDKVPELFLFRPQVAEIQDFAHTGTLQHVHIVYSWSEIENALQL